MAIDLDLVAAEPGRILDGRPGDSIRRVGFARPDVDRASGVGVDAEPAALGGSGGVAGDVRPRLHGQLAAGRERPGDGRRRRVVQGRGRVSVDAGAEAGTVRPGHGVRVDRRGRIDREVIRGAEHRARGDRDRRCRSQRRCRVRLTDRDEAAAAVRRDRRDLAAVVGLDDDVQGADLRASADRIRHLWRHGGSRGRRLDVDDAAARARSPKRLRSRRPTERPRAFRPPPTPSRRCLPAPCEVRSRTRLLLPGAGGREVDALDGEDVRAAVGARRCRGRRSRCRRSCSRAGSSMPSG